MDVGVEPVSVHDGQATGGPPLRWYVRMVRRYLGAGPYLDFGCGTGQLLRRLAAHGSATGFESSPSAAAQARTGAPGCPVHTTLDCIPSGVYRGVTAVGVLDLLDDGAVAEALTCWRRVLVPGGRALVVVVDPAGRARELAGARWAGLRASNLKPHTRWRESFVRAGFTVVREGSDGLWNGPYGQLPAFLDAVVHAVPSVTQFCTGRLSLRPGAGESSVFVLETPSAG